VILHQVLELKMVPPAVCTHNKGFHGHVVTPMTGKKEKSMTQLMHFGHFLGFQKLYAGNN